MTPQRSFGDLTSAELADWMARDPDGYFAAGEAWAREVAERDYEREMRRRRAQDRERLLRPFRRLLTAARTVFGGRS